jgi:holo-[acyl-carrier protein] synthase
MITGIGTDIVFVERFDAWVKDASIVKRFFHADECAVFESIAGRSSGHSFKAASLFLAGRFAAKEAFSKALGTGIRGFRLSDIRVLNDSLGKPVMTLYGGAASLLAKMGAGRVHVSLSHDGGYALAFVALET